MSTTLYRKYRPQTFANVVGQPHIVRTLENALLHGRIGHAYLFTGPRGTGKTTLARLFARALNCSDRRRAEPCLACPHCLAFTDNRSLDIIEIDAASHTGVDHIRELRETIRLAPTLGPYKVYIIDEVHMLSGGAWNALLKTLEEPPVHAIFILATTEVHKIPATILSRCQRFDFTRFPLEHILTKLGAIASTEGVSIEPEALEMIALSAEGGMRDAESLLAQVISLEDKHITTQEVSDLLGLTSQQSITQFVRAIATSHPDEAFLLLQTLAGSGLNLVAFADALLHVLRRLLIVTVAPSLAESFRSELSDRQFAAFQELSNSFQAKDIITLVELFVVARRDIRLSAIPELPLEIALAKYFSRNTGVNSPQVTQMPATSAPGSAQATPIRPQATPIVPQPSVLTQKAMSTPTEKPVIPAPSAISTPKPELVEVPSATEPSLSFPDILRLWPMIVSSAKDALPSLGFLLSAAQPVDFKGNALTLRVAFAIHKQQLAQAKIDTAFGAILTQHLGFRPKIVTTVNETTPAAPDSSPILVEALAALGGRLVTEK